MTRKKKPVRKQRATKKRPSRSASVKQDPPAAAAADPAPSPSRPSAFRNRIVGYELVDVGAITRNPLNWRAHPDAQRSAMSDLLGQLGYVDVCLVNKRTGRLIDGEMRLDIAEAKGETQVPVLWVDLSDDEERLALATINPMSELAATDPDKLGELLAGVEHKGGPLDELLRELEQQADLGTVKRASASSGNGTKREAASPGHTVRIVLKVVDVADVERALRATKIANRGDALVEICREYLRRDEDHEEGRRPEAQEHGAAAEGEFADQFAQALAAAADGH